MFIGIGFGLFWPMFGYGGSAPAVPPVIPFGMMFIPQ